MKTRVTLFRQASFTSMRGLCIARGFTLIELMVTLAVIAVLAGVAGAQLAPFIQNSRLSSAASLLQADLQLARRETIKRNMPVPMCAVGSISAPHVRGSAWTAGWMICYRKLISGSHTISARQRTPSWERPQSLVTGGAPDSTPVLTGLPTTAPFVLFNADGTQRLRGSPADLCFTVKGNWTGTKTYAVKVPPTGSISLNTSCTRATISDANCQPLPFKAG